MPLGQEVLQRKKMLVAEPWKDITHIKLTIVLPFREFSISTKPRHHG